METRIAKINELIRSELSKIMTRTIEFPLGTLVTITSVESDPEAKEATVFLTIFPSDREQEVITLLKKLSGPLQHTLNRTLSMRFVPQLSYQIDRDQTRGYEIETILDSIKED